MKGTETEPSGPVFHQSLPIGDYTSVDIHVLQGGRAPERKTDGAIGYDVYARAVVSEFLKDPNEPRLRETEFDFRNIPYSQGNRIKNQIQQYLVISLDTSCSSQPF